MNCIDELSELSAISSICIDKPHLLSKVDKAAKMNYTGYQK